MMMIEVRAYQPGDILMIDVQDSQKYDAETAAFTHRLVTDRPHGAAVSFFAGQICVACGGIEPFPGAPYRAFGWALIGQPSRAGWGVLLRQARIMLDDGLMRYRRIETYCDAARPEQAAVLDRLGFQREGVMRGWGWQGQDCLLASLVRSDKKGTGS